MQEFVKETSTNTYQMNALPRGLMQRSLSILQSLGNQNMNALENNVMEKNAIMCQDGIFTIMHDIETSSVKQDPALKALIDSVLK